MKKSYTYVFTIISIIVACSIYILSVRGDIGNFETGNAIMEQNPPGIIYEYANSPFEFPRVRTQYTTLIALATTFRVDIGEDLARAGYPDTTVSSGQFFSYANPGLAIIALPLYLMGSIYGLGQYSAGLLVGIIGLINIYCIYYISRKIFNFTHTTSLLSSFIYGFATMAWVYSSTFIYHTPINFLLLIIIIMTARLVQEENVIKQRTFGRFLWISFGMIVLFDNPAFVALLPVPFIILFILRKKSSLRPFLETSAWAILILSTTALSQQLIYGNWRELSNDQDQYRFTRAFVEKTLPVQKISPSPNILKPTRKQDRELSFKVLKNDLSLKNIEKNTHTTLFSARKGLFIVSPILIFALFGLRKKMLPFVYAHIPIIISILLLYGSFGPGDGANSFGPRYLIPLLPLLSILAAYGIYMIRKRALMFWISFACLIFSILTTATSAISRLHNGTPHYESWFGIQNFEGLLQNYSGMFIYDVWLRNSVPLIYIYILFCTALAIIAYGIYRNISIEDQQIR